MTSWAHLVTRNGTTYMAMSREYRDKHQQEHQTKSQRARARKRGEDVPLLKCGRESTYDYPVGSPKYRRQQGERVAAKSGRSLGVYMTRRAHEEHANGDREEVLAARVRRGFVRDWLRPFRDALAIELALSPEYRSGDAEAARQRYECNRVAEIERVASRKRDNPDRNVLYGVVRDTRLRQQSDGSVTRESVNGRKVITWRCQYCGGWMAGKGKQTDHMVALALGGEHSMRNIAIVCASCNMRKGTLSYAKWVDRIASEHRERVSALWVERYGEEKPGLQYAVRSCWRDPYGSDPVQHTPPPSWTTHIVCPISYRV